MGRSFDAGLAGDPALLGLLVLQAAPVIVLVFGFDGSVQYVNPHFEELTGFTLDELRGRDWFEHLLPARDRARIRELFESRSLGADPKQHQPGSHQGWTRSRSRMDRRNPAR